MAAVEFPAGRTAVSAQRPEPGPSHAEQSPSRRAASRRSGTGNLGKLARRLGLTVGGVALLAAGIAMGNGARKRIDRLAHGF